MTNRKFPNAKKPCDIGLVGFSTKKGKDKAMIKLANILMTNPVVNCISPLLFIISF